MVMSVPNEPPPPSTGGSPARVASAVPTDSEAEGSVVGMLLQQPYEIEQTSTMLAAEDFWQPRLGALYEHLVGMWEEGAAIDARSVAARTKGTMYEWTSTALTALAVDAPLSTHLPTHMNRVIEMASRRRLIATADEVRRLASDQGSRWADVAGLAQEHITAAAADTDAVARVLDVSEFIERYDVDPVWVVPEMIERGDKVLIIGLESGGKSMMIRQWAVQISHGIHPRGRTPIKPRRVLLVDLENGPRLIAKWVRRVRGVALESNPEAPADNLRIESRIDGIDLTSRVDRRWLASRVADARPDVLMIGPLYKMHRGEEERSSDAGTIARELDALRARFGCALIMETHAPHESFKEGGILRPAGSRVWMRWPDFILGLKPERPSQPTGPHLLDDSVKSRDVRRWPRRFVRGDRWPWDDLPTRPTGEQP